MPSVVGDLVMHRRLRLAWIRQHQRVTVAQRSVHRRVTIHFDFLPPFVSCSAASDALFSVSSRKGELIPGHPGIHRIENLQAVKDKKIWFSRDTLYSVIILFLGKNSICHWSRPAELELFEI